MAVPGRALIFAGTAALVACTALTDLSGLEGPAAKFTADAVAVESSPDDAARVVPSEALQDGSSDSGVDSGIISVSTVFATVNGASFITTASGTTITGYSGTTYHAIIVPSPQPSIPSEDFTVIATVSAPTNGEFGILTRVQPDGSGVLYGSKFSTENKPFVGTVTPPEWSPIALGRGVSYVYQPNARYRFKLKAVGNTVSAKMWDASQAEPAAFEVTTTTSFPNGKGVGFYTYGLNDALLEGMSITVP